MSQEVRDKLAGLEGWEAYTAANGIVVWHCGSILDGTYEQAKDHPIPDDLTTCAAMWDKYAGRLVLCMHVAYLTARERNGKGVKAIKRTGTDAASELRDRWRLLWEVLKARGVV